MGAWCPARRSIDLEQSLGPQEPGCARTSEHGHEGCRHRRLEGSARRSPLAGRHRLCRRARRQRPRRADRAALAAHPDLVVVEATGGFETVVAAALAGAGLPLVVANPAQIRHFAQAAGTRAKTDPIDAAMIARFGHDMKPDVRPLPDEATQLLADLVARRRQIIEMIVAERNRERRDTVRRIKKSIARHVRALEKELAEIDAEIDAGVRGSPAWRDKEDLLASVPGVGPVVARTLIAELPELGTLDKKKIASLAGLAPYTRQSGQWKGKSMIGGGRKSVRCALFLAALVASRHKPRPQGLPRSPPRRRQAQDGRPHRRRPQAPHHPQHHPARPKTMAARLTRKTVAPPLRG